MPKTSLEICAHVIALHTKQRNCHTIAKKLGTTPSTINCIIKHYKAMRKLEDKGRSGCPRIHSERVDCYLAQLAQTKEQCIIFKCQRILQEVSIITTSSNTVRRALKCQRLYSAIKKKKYLLSDHHKPLRHEWAKEHKDWTEDQWR